MASVMLWQYNNRNYIQMEILTSTVKFFLTLFPLGPVDIESSLGLGMDWCIKP